MTSQPCCLLQVAAQGKSASLARQVGEDAWQSSRLVKNQGSTIDNCSILEHIEGIMFEKSLYDLIRGMRNHKGNEREYIQGCLKECRAEIRTQDLDLKATALLKLVYLEQFGHDMSWASFHVLEVMASPKYHQKRVGYLGAVQSFRPETEVLMLATNLLKKDLTSAATTTIALPIVALPHVITPSLALSTLSDLIPRLSHSHPVIRKKTIVTLYRLALVYPEALRAAWPKIKEKLMDATEDPSVTAAIVNVVCELGWRRPHDFLPLAPRLFELLVDSGNNWMAIKLIKLFATLTPLEPRLARKLLPPLTEIIRTTPAMSLLYECINGIIQGGILGSGEDEAGREEIASLCVSKLRSMIMVDGDPNLKYVALLAFNKIVVTHPWLVAQQEDVILECIDSTDISIRIKALDLVQGMVSSDNLVSIVGRLMRQLKRSTAEKDRNAAIDPTELDSDEESLERRIDSDQRTEEREAPLPDDYRIDVIYRILGMCSASNYSNLSDFVWYIDILTQLVRMAPLPRSRPEMDAMSSSSRYDVDDVSEQIGNELRSVAVKVQAMRPTCVLASGRIIGQLNDDVPVGHAVTSGSLKPVAWIVGEYASHLASGEDQLGDLLRLTPRIRDPETVASFLQALTKIFSFVAANDRSLWTAERKSKISLLMARIIHTLEPLVMHPNLEVQERAVEYSELLKLTAEAVSGQEVVVDGVQQDAPLLLTQAIPSLFSGWELNSVAPAAQKSVPLPDGLDLDEPINSNLHSLLANAGSVSLPDDEVHGFEMYYHQRPPPISLGSVPAVKRLVDERDGRQEVASSYQQPAEDSYLDADILARRKAERQERYRDDPFYIGGSDSRPRSTTPIHNILQSSNGPDLDVDSIPIMELDLDKLSAHVSGSVPARKSSPLRPQLRQKITVAADETLAGGSSTTPRNYDSENNSDGVVKSRIRQGKQSVLLGVDSTNLQSLNLEDDPEGSGFDFEAKQREDAEMARAMREVERLRLEMQRANERVQVAQGVDAEGTVVKKKAKKKAAVPSPAEDGTGASKAVKKKKKKKLKADEDGGGARGGDTGTAIGETAEDANGASSTTTAVKPKQKKRARTAEIQDLG